MTPDMQKCGSAETEIRKEYENGQWKVVVRKNKKFIKETYCLSAEHADIIKGQYKNMYWGYQLN